MTLTKNGIRKLPVNGSRPKTKRPTVSKSKLRILFDLTYGKCWYCAVQMVMPAKTNHTQLENECTFDHVHPLSKGGKQGAAACHRCNRDKGDKDLDWLRKHLGIELFYFELLGLEIGKPLRKTVGG